MPIYEQTPMRLKLTFVGNPPGYPINQATGESPKMWRSADASISVGVFDGSGNPVDLANIVAGQLQLAIFKQSTDVVPILVKSLTGDSIYPLITTAGWENGTQQNATFILTKAEMDISTQAGASDGFWLLVQGITADGNRVIYAGGPMSLIEPGQIVAPAPYGYVSRNKQSNTAGNSTAGVDGAIPSLNHTQIFDIGGAARTSDLILPIVGMVDGAKLVLILLLPATTSIILRVKNATVGGTVLSTIETGSVLQAVLMYEFSEENQAWEPYLYALPGI